MLARILLKFALFASVVAAFAYSGGAAWGLGLGCVIASVGWAYGNSRLYKAFRWLEAPTRESAPSGRGLWDGLFALMYREQRAQQRRVEELADSLDRFRKAVQALPDGVITLTRDNLILFCNPVAIDMFGLDPQADTGYPITNLVRLPEFSSYLRSNDWRKPVTLRVRSGALRTLQVQLIEVGDGQRLLLARDVTQLDRLETMRRDFVANVSHELKTPLTVLGGFLETLRDHEDMPRGQKRHFIDVMTEQAARMHRIVEDLLALSALEAAPHAPRDTVVALDPVIARIETAARSLSGERHALRFELQPGLALYGAETEIASAFENLVSNAIRYTPDGGRIDIRLSADVDGLRFSVSDTGIGIEAQHIPRLTERFYRVDRGRSRESGGTGLGLAIVKHVLTRHDAKLRIESVYGRGTAMTAEFPARRLASHGARNSLQSSANET